MSRLASPLNYRRNSFTDYASTLNFGSLTGWTVAGNGTNKVAAVDTAYTKTGLGSIKLSYDSMAPNANAINIDKQGLSLDFSDGGAIGVLCGFQGTDEATRGINCAIDLTVGNDNSLTKNARLVVVSGSAKDPWEQLLFLKSAFAESGGFSWKDPITRIRLMVAQVTTTGNVDVWFDSVAAVPNCRPKITWTFDDAYLSAKTFHDTSLAARGWLSGFAITSSAVGTGTGDPFITLAEIQTLYAAGNDICNHSYTHTGLATQTIAQAEIDTLLSKTWALSNGFTRGSDICIYVGGSYNQDVVDMLQNNGFNMGMTVDSGSRQTYCTPTWYGKTDMFRIPRLDMKSTVSLATAKTAMDNAIKYGQSLHIYGHQFVAAAPSGSQWLISDGEALAAYAQMKEQQGMCDIVSPTKWRNGFDLARVAR